MPRLILIGLAAGFFSALFGVGGGVIIVPLLILAAGFAERPATATSLAAIGVTAAAGTVAYAFHGHVQPEWAALVGVPAMAGAVLGTSLQQRVANRTISLLFAGLLVAVAILLVLE